MQCYTELTPPTAVSHALSLPFLSASANNLVVAKTSLLQIFSLKSVVTHTHDPSLSGSAPNSASIKRENANDLDFSVPNSATTHGERLQTTKLVLVAQYELAGSVTSLARVKILQSKSGGEALLVALKDAKLSLIEWDPERYCISTISIHYYEREGILSSPLEPDLAQCVNYLSVDPRSRCAVLKFGTRHLAILPFHQSGDDLVMDDYDPDIDGELNDRKSSVTKNAVHDATGEKTPYAASFVLSLLALDPSLSHPVHLSFLYEYREPTFGVLYSQVASSSGLLHERRDNVSYAVYTLDLEQQASTTLLSVNNLPYDLHAIVPLSRRIGGALLVGANEIIHVDQSGKTNGIAVNELAKQSTSFPLVDLSDLIMRLEGCVVKELGLDTSELLIVLYTGELAILSFTIDGRSVSGLSLRRVNAENGGGALPVGPSCASIIGRGRLFIGSEGSDSMIIGWSRKSDRLKRQRSRVDMDLDVDDDGQGLDEEDLEDDDDLYAENKVGDGTREQGSLAASTEKPEYSFRIHDSLMNIGPLTDVALRRQIHDRTNKIDSERSLSATNLLASSGRHSAGGLTLIEQGIRNDLTEELNISNARALWSINLKKSLGSGSTDNHQEEYFQYAYTSAIDDNEAEKSRVYRIEGRTFKEINDVEFDVDAGNTIDMATINSGTLIAQVSQNQVRTYDGGESFLVLPYHACCFIMRQSCLKVSTARNSGHPDLIKRLWRQSCLHGDVYFLAIRQRGTQYFVQSCLLAIIQNPIQFRADVSVVLYPYVSHVNWFDPAADPL